MYEAYNEWMYVWRLLRLLFEEDWIGEFKLSQNQIMIHSRVADNKKLKNIWWGKLFVKLGTSNSVLM